MFDEGEAGADEEDGEEEQGALHPGNIMTSYVMCVKTDTILIIYLQVSDVIQNVEGFSVLTVDPQEMKVNLNRNSSSTTCK